MRRVLTALVAVITILAFLAWQLELPLEAWLRDGWDQGTRWWDQGPSAESDGADWRAASANVLSHGPGDPLALELVEAPATHYGVDTWTGSDRAYAAMVGDLDGIQYEPSLGHVARELAAFHALEGELPPSGATAFLLNAGGASAWDVAHTMLVGAPDGDAPIRERVRALWRNQAVQAGMVRVGIGEAYAMGASFQRHIAVVLCRRGLVLAPTPRRVSPGATFRLEGTLPEGFQAPRVVIGGPESRPRQVPVSARGRAIRVDLPAGDEVGMIGVEILADGPRGAAPLAQLQLHVGEPLPTGWRGFWPPDEGGLETLPQLEADARQHLERDRAAFGLAPLVLDDALSRVARDHSEDMRDGRFFGHVSPRTGGPGDRLLSAGLRTLSYAENVAANDSLWDAQRGLFESLGHRRNMLEPSHSHLGIGVAESYEDGRRVFHVTQLFARPWVPADPVQAERGVLARLSVDREAAGAPKLRRQAALDEVALDLVAGRVTSPRDVLDLAKARGLVRRGAWSAVVDVGDPQMADWPPESLDPTWRRVGVAVWQDVDAAAPRGRVILLLAR